MKSESSIAVLSSTDLVLEPLETQTRARVIINANARVGVLDYLCPIALRPSLGIGTPVWVPLGKRRVSGYIAELIEPNAPSPADVPLASLKNIDAIDADKPALSSHVVALILFCASYYHASASDVLAAALPLSARPLSSRFRLAEAGELALNDPSCRPDDIALLQIAHHFRRGFSVAAIERGLKIDRQAALNRLRRLRDKHWLELVQPRRTKPRTLSFYRRLVSDEQVATLFTPRQKRAREALACIPTDTLIGAPELHSNGVSIKSLRALEDAKHIERVVKPLAPRSTNDANLTELTSPQPTLTQAQHDAVEQMQIALDARAFQVFGLHGVTGSGKTEVYLHLIAKALDNQRTALVLVPEIALTPQLGARFAHRFGDCVATFHSALSVAERRSQWDRVAAGEVRVVLGARSAIFLPLQNLGVIVVDEEHETSFKQEETPRYNARDLAVYRGRIENAVVVLGSATPSLETFQNCNTKRYVTVKMPERVRSLPMPTVECIDLRQEERVGDGVFTVRLARALEHTLRRDEQTILFLNRRGFAPYVFCRDCGHSFKCVDCNVSLTLHQKRGRLICHYCSYEISAPSSCAACHGHHVEAFGLGTERVEAEIKALFGNLPLARLDRDTVRTRAQLSDELRRFAQGQAKIMVGTQMVAKGHDFPGVTLVGVIAADASLNLPDFRAAERTFQLLTQVAGRAGRGDKPGIVLVQSYEQEHYAIQTAKKHDYATFAQIELETRRALGYPPYTHLALVRLESPSQDDATAAAAACAQALRTTAPNDPVLVLGPAPSPLARIKGAWRMQILLKSATRASLHQALGHLPRSKHGVRQIVDIDPFSML